MGEKKPTPKGQIIPIEDPMLEKELKDGNPDALQNLLRRSKERLSADLRAGRVVPGFNPETDDTEG